MPTYDVHTHVGLDQGFMLRGWWPYAATVQDLTQHMDAHGIDRACCFPFTLSAAYDPYKFADEGKVELLPGRVPFERENLLLVQEAETLGGGRLLVLAMFDPSRKVSGQLKNIEPLVGRIAGLKLQATVIQSFVADLLDGGRDLMAFAEQHDLLVLIHTSYVASDIWSQSKDCLRVAAAYPRVRFNLAHTFRFHLEDMKAAASMPNVWSDCSAHLAHCSGALKEMSFVAPRGRRPDADYSKPSDVLEACHNILGERFLWGSDNPYMSWCADGIVEVHRYADEVAALRATPARIQRSMGQTAPEAWLYGERRGRKGTTR